MTYEEVYKFAFQRGFVPLMKSLANQTAKVK